MVENSLAYGDQIFRFNIHLEHILKIVTAKQVRIFQPAKEIIRKRLNSPIASPTIADRFHPGEKTVIIVPDKTRKCGAAIFLPILVERLNGVGIEGRDIKIILATGSHGLHEPEEIEEVVGTEISRSIKIIDHNCHDSEELVYLGTTRFGTPVHINRHVVTAKRIIVTGTAVHHYFAGYGGGPKMINPGCAGYETITKNHAMTIDSQTGGIHSKCRTGFVKGNPIQEDIIDSMKFIKADFLLETILNEQGEIVEIVCGDLFKAHQKACEIVDSIYKIHIQKRADLVVVSCGGYPKDINFIQAHKSLHNAFSAVKPRGVILFLAECRDGIGSQTFLEWFRYSNNGELQKALRENYKVNGTTALSLKMKTQSAKIIFVTKLEPELVKELGMIPASTLEEGWSLAHSLLAKDFKSYMIPNGSLTLPILDENDE